MAKDQSDPSLEFSQDVIDQWNKNFADHTVQSDKKLIRLHGILYKVKDHGDKLLHAYEAVDILLNASPTDSPGDSLRQFRTLFDAVRDLVPYVPGFYEFLAGYSTIMDGIASKLDEIARNIYMSEKDLFVLHPGVWPGGWFLEGYMQKLLKSKEPMDVPPEVISWVKKNHDGLALATGEDPPAKTERFLGIDILARDSVDKLALKMWFFTHRQKIKSYAYGRAELL